MSFINELRKAIENKIDREDVTITEISNHAKCSRQMIYNFLAGKNISVGLVERIADFCGLKLKVISGK